MTDIGHNSINAGTAKKLKDLLERIERLENEKHTIAEDIKEVYSEVKADGFDAKVLRKLVAIRKKDAEAVKAEQEILEVYAHALGMGIFG